ncbi:MAG: DUF362 domain-containing protein [Candidatus Latescibacteria bacterium]|nr:DUF362 domain-containing protein [Candidatus Latescibacterota bacterium]
MSRKNKNKVIAAVCVLILFAVVLDVFITRRNTSFLSLPATDSFAARSEDKAIVAISTSEDKELAAPVPLDAEKLTYDQIDAVVRRALDLDTSKTGLVNVIKPEDWVIVKLNMVHAPVRDADGKRQNANFWRHDFEHWGDVTDARVVKSVVNYMTENIKPKRITLVEGSATWAVAGKYGKGPQYEQSFEDDGWTVHWREFDNICYKEMCEAFSGAQNHTVVDYIDLNEDEYRFVPVPGGAFQYVDAKFRDGKKFGRLALIPGSGKIREGYYMPETILQADKLVNIPAFKMNSAGGTLLFKNYVGAFASIPFGDGIAKSQMDRFGFAHGMIDIYSYKPTDYGIIAGFWASEKDWPSHTTNLHHNVVIVGGNTLATEATALRVMGVNPYDVIWTYLAEAKGFGRFDEKDISVVGPPVREIRRNFIKHSSYQGIGFQNYLMNGPYKETDLDKDLLGSEATIKPVDGDTTSGKPWWVFKHPFGFPEAYVSLNENLDGDLTNTITYAYLCLESPKIQEGMFTFGFDDGAKVYLNGKVIFSDDGPREYKIREEKIPITLARGENHLLIKLKNRFGDAGFASSIEDDSESRLFDLEVIVPKEQGMALPAVQTGKI